MRQYLVSQIQRKKMELSEMEEETKGLQNQLKRANKKIEKIEKENGGSYMSSEEREEQGIYDSEVEALKADYEAKEIEMRKTIQKLTEKDTANVENLKNLELKQSQSFGMKELDKLFSFIDKMQPSESKKIYECEVLDDKVEAALSILEKVPSLEQFTKIEENKAQLEQQLVDSKEDFNKQLKENKESLGKQVEEASANTKKIQESLEQLEESTKMLSDQKQKLRNQMSSISVEKVEIEKKLLKMQALHNGSQGQILEEKLNTIMKEYQASKDTVQKQSDLIKRLKETIANERSKPKLASPTKAAILANEEIQRLDVKPVESLLDLSKTQIEEIMKVNKSYEDGAFKSAERYKMLKDLYDSTMKKLKAANELTTSLQKQMEEQTEKYQKELDDEKQKIYRQMDEDREKLKEWENMYKNMKNKFESEQKELTQEYDHELMEKMKEIEEANTMIVELEDALAEEEQSKENLLKNFINVEESVVKLAGEHEEQEKEYVETIANITAENESLQRDLGATEGELDASKTKLSLAKNEVIGIRKKMEKGENERVNLVKVRSALESKVREMEQLFRKEKRSQEKLKSEIEKHDEVMEMKKQDIEHEKQKQAKIIFKLTELTEKLEKQLNEEKIKNGSHIGKIEVERGELQDDLHGALDDLEEKQRMIDDLRAQLEDEKHSISMLESEMDHLKVALMRDDQNKNEEYAEIESKIDELHDHNEELENRLSAMKLHYESEIESLEQKLHQQVQEKVTLKDEIKTIEKAVIVEAQQHEKEMNEYKDMIDTADEQKEELRNMIVLLERELEKTGSK